MTKKKRLGKTTLAEVKADVEQIMAAVLNALPAPKSTLKPTTRKTKR
jgi:hypothetical protein